MIITTASRPTKELIATGIRIAKELHTMFVPRNNESIREMQRSYESDILVVGKNRLQVFRVGSGEPMFFHPNSAMFRYKRLVSNEHDPLIDVSELHDGMSFLDCTLGLSSDSIIASYVVGPLGKVVGIEGSQVIAYLTKMGLKSWHSGINAFDEAMRRITVIHEDYSYYLTSLPDKSFDIVYFDPMFDEKIINSDGIKNLRYYAQYTTITDQVIDQAKRVARKKVIFKDHFRSKRFAEFGFHVFKRPSAKFHFGVIDIMDEK